MVEGRDLVTYLITEIDRVYAVRKVVTGIVVGSAVRRMLTRECYRALGQEDRGDSVVNRFRGILLIEDGVNPERVELIIAPLNTVLPLEGSMLLRGRG